METRELVRREPVGLSAVALERAPKSVNETLMGFVDSQRDDLSTLRRSIHDRDKLDEIVRRYLESEGLKEAEAEVLVNVKNIPINDIAKNSGERARLVGKIFQDLSFAYFALRQGSSEILLSPERTRLLFKTIFPNAKDYPNSLGLDSLVDTPPPDGIVIAREGREKYVIKTVVEYTTSSQKRIEKVFKGKLKNFNKQRTNIESSAFLENAKLEFVVPKGRSPLTNTEEFDVKESPFYLQQIEDLRDKVFSRIIKRINSPRKNPVGTVA